MNISAIEKLNILLKELALRILTLNYFIIKRIIKKKIKLKNKEKILDVGCGTGLLAPLFPPKNYFGIDIDSKLIAFAKSRYPKYSFQTKNAAALKFPKETFGRIVIIGVIHHLDPITAKKVMQQLKKVLKKNGEILLIEAIPPINPFNFIGQLLRLFDEGHYIRSINDYKKLFSHYLTIQKSYRELGGFFDYGVFILEK